MNIILAALLAMAMLIAFALPIRLALTRGSWRAAGVAVLIGLAIPAAALYVFNYVVSDFFVGIVGILIGVPLIAIVTSLIVLLAIDRIVPKRPVSDKVP